MKRRRIEKPTTRNTAASELLWLVGEAFRQTRQPIDQLVRDYGVTATQFGILKRLADNPGLSAADVARHNFISPQAAHVALTTLERKGLVTRDARTDNRRISGAELTKRGERVLETCRDAVQPIGEHFFVTLTTNERRVLVELLRRCIAESGD